jgi:hypothetical protein
MEATRLSEILIGQNAFPNVNVKKKECNMNVLLLYSKDENFNKWFK